jgi:hypothetical protein
MKKSLFVYSITLTLSLLTGAVHADNICHSRAEARRHTALSQARLAYLGRVKSCQSMPSPDRAEGCIKAAKATFERDSQAARARYAQDVRACGTET